MANTLKKIAIRVGDETDGPREFGIQAYDEEGKPLAFRNHTPLTMSASDLLDYTAFAVKFLEYYGKRLDVDAVESAPSKAEREERWRTYIYTKIDGASRAEDQQR